MDTPEETLRIELEDMAGASWWSGILATLSSQYGNAYLRFVGRVGDERRYIGPTFPSPRTLGTLPPQEDWAPEMGEALATLREEIEADGWHEVAVDEQPWMLRYERT